MESVSLTVLIKVFMIYNGTCLLKPPKRLCQVVLIVQIVLNSQVEQFDLEL